MYVDPSGHAWYDVFAWIGVGLFAAALTVATLGAAGIAIGGIAGGIIMGAAIGTLALGTAGAAIGAIGGMIYDVVESNAFGTSIWLWTKAGFGVGAIAGAWALIDDKSFGSNEFWSYVLYGGLLGLGIGSLIGAILGGHIGANGWYSAKAIEFTNAGSNEVVLGRSPGYVNVAKNKGATYFNTKDAIWNATKSMKGVGKKGMWRINKAFLKQQIKAGAHFTLVNQVSGYYYAKEVAYVMKYGIYTFL